MRDDLSDLLRRAQAKGAQVDRRLSYDVLRALLGRNGCHAWLYGAQRGHPHSSVDAGLRLAEQVLPDHGASIHRGIKGRFWTADIGAHASGRHPTPALALLVALLIALVALQQEAA